MAREEIKRAKEFLIEFIGKHPQHKDEAIDLFTLCVDEIDEGGSPQHETELFISSCEQLLEEDEEDSE